MDEAAVAACLPGSIMELEDGKYAVIPVKSATRKDQAKGFQIKLTTDGHDFGFRTWAELKIKIASIAVGVLTDGNKEGSQASSLNIGGVPATLSVTPAPEKGGTIVSLELSTG